MARRQRRNQLVLWAASAALALTVMVLAGLIYFNRQGPPVMNGFYNLAVASLTSQGNVDDNLMDTLNSRLAEF